MGFLTRRRKRGKATKDTKKEKAIFQNGFSGWAERWRMMLHLYATTFFFVSFVAFLFFVFFMLKSTVSSQRQIGAVQLPMGHR